MVQAIAQQPKLFTKVRRTTSQTCAQKY